MTARILLVDDHPVFRQGLYHLLAREKDLTIVGEADDGQMAIEQVQQKKPDLVVMDINMPRLDGFGFIDAVRSSPRHANVPILVLTTESSTDLKTRARTAGMLPSPTRPSTETARKPASMSGNRAMTRAIWKAAAAPRPKRKGFPRTAIRSMSRRARWQGSVSST